MMMSRMNVEEEDDKDDIVAEDKVKVDDVEDHQVKREEDDHVENNDVDGKDDDVEVEDRSQDRKLTQALLREPAQSKHTWRFYKSHFILQFIGGKNARTKKRDPDTCASLRSRNAIRHFIKATLY